MIWKQTPNARKFLDKNDSVQITVTLKGRERGVKMRQDSYLQSLQKCAIQHLKVYKIVAIGLVQN